MYCKCCFFSRATDQQYGLKNTLYLKTARSCMDTPMNIVYSSKGHIKTRSLLPCRHTDNDITIA